MNDLPTKTGEEAFGDPLNDDEEFDRLAQEAVQDALRGHKRRGESIVVWRDGQIVTLAPEDIPVDDEPGAVAQAA